LIGTWRASGPSAPRKVMEALFGQRLSEALPVLATRHHPASCGQVVCVLRSAKILTLKFVSDPLEIRVAFCHVAECFIEPETGM
jgi:hypothetical protein